MSHSRHYLIWIGAVCSMILPGCTTDQTIKTEILHIEGVTWACNVSTFYSFFGSSSESEENPEVWIPASDGDLLYMVNENETSLYYRFRGEDGNQLVVSQDTAKSSLSLINGKLAQVDLSEDSGLDELENGLMNVQPGESFTIFISDSVTGEMIGKLKDLRPKLKGTGIFLDSDLPPEQFRELMSVCSPEWLASESVSFDSIRYESRLFDHLEYLWITGSSVENILMQPYCRNLETLVIAEWDPGKDGILSLSDYRKCHTLVLTECDISDLSAVEFPSRLQRLHLVACDTLTDISRIKEIPGLKSLGLSGSDDVTSPDAIGELTGLKRIAFPANTSQEEFASILDRLPSLEEVDLINCRNVVDLSPLKDKENLEILALHTVDMWPQNLESLTQLEMVILTADIFEDNPERIAELHRQLPNTLIVPGSGLCMGSGWLLLLVPLVIISRLLFRKR